MIETVSFSNEEFIPAYESCKINFNYKKSSFKTIDGKSFLFCKKEDVFDVALYLFYNVMIDMIRELVFTFKQDIIKQEQVYGKEFSRVYKMIYTPSLWICGEKENGEYEEFLCKINNYDVNDFTNIVNGYFSFFAEYNILFDFEIQDDLFYYAVNSLSNILFYISRRNLRKRNLLEPYGLKIRTANTEDQFQSFLSQIKTEEIGILDLSEHIYQQDMMNLQIS
jgi:hypothetical protein